MFIVPSRLNKQKYAESDCPHSQMLLTRIIMVLVDEVNQLTLT
jgi:hypothetical protein